MWNSTKHQAAYHRRDIRFYGEEIHSISEDHSIIMVSFVAASGEKHHF
ncbi:MAG: hypothetical protein P8P30_01315 [Rickettsiales bacterium]|nr:hypothetical protein [Rickettsiales bacterium]